MHRLRHHRCCCHRCRRCGPDCLRCGICSHLPWQRHSAGRPQSHGRTLPCSCDCMAWQRQRALPVPPQRLAPSEPRPRPLVPSELRLPAPPPTQRAPSSGPRSHAPAAAPPPLLPPLPALGCGPDRLRRGICSHLPWQRHSAGRPQSHGRTLPCSCDCMAWQRQRQRQRALPYHLNGWRPQSHVRVR